MTPQRKSSNYSERKTMINKKLTDPFVGSVTLALVCRIAAWAVLGALLVTAGCLMESVTTVGHHLLFILAGAALGIGIYREVR